MSKADSRTEAARPWIEDGQPPVSSPTSSPSDEARPIKPHRSGGGAPFFNEAEDRQYAEWARAQDDDHLQHWATGTPMDRDALLKQIAAKRENQRRATSSPSDGTTKMTPAMEAQTTPPLEQRLREIEGRANAATPGPWEWTRTYELSDDDGRLRKHWAVTNPERESQGMVIWPLVTLANSENAYGPDMEFIAHAREDIPFLIAALRAAPRFTEEDARRLVLSTLNATIVIATAETRFGIEKSNKAETVERIVAVLREAGDWPHIEPATEVTSE